jgi:SAM-dependent methyltransferase
MHFRLGRRLWWKARKRRETTFWRAWLAGAPGTEEWASDREARLNPDTEVGDPVVRAELERIPHERITILDVGAGPITKLGYRYPGKTLAITAVDPLADEYDRLLAEAGLDPPVRTTRVAGEDVLVHFGSSTFDVACATNSLDHSADPFRIISNMVDVVRRGGVVLLRHKRNEGESARYEGLHQWNFDVVDEKLTLWNNAVEIEVGLGLGGRARTTAWIEGDQVIARLERL